jgi:glyoxylase-like metal-dependent hydrolase (beta-lactamase superfamily II)
VIVIETQAAPPFFKNGFVVGCDRTREAVLIDPGEELDDLLRFADRGKFSIGSILLTHAHVDHVTGVPRAKKALNVPIRLHKDDLFLYEAAREQAAMFGLQIDPLPPVDRFYDPGEVIKVGDLDLRVHHTPGHCPGGVCLQVGDDLFVGDTLFAGSIGRTDFPGGDYSTLMASIKNVLFGFGDGARVHPGHGPSTTIGQERRTNPFL